MIRKKWLFIGILSIALVFSMVFTACSDGAAVEEEEEEELLQQIDPYAAAKPIITDQSGTKRYVTGSPVTPILSVTATLSDPATYTSGSFTSAVTYQWFEAATYTTKEDESTPVTGTGANGTLTWTGSSTWNDTLTYTAPALTAGTKYYYVAFTNIKTITLTKEDGSEEEIERTSVTASGPMGVILIDGLPNPDATVTVTATQNQYVRGFGGMSNAFSIGTPARYMEMADIDTMFGPNGLGFKMLRIMIWPNPLDDVTAGRVQPQMANQRTYIQSVQKVNQYGGYVLASPWTAPANMKTNNSVAAGGSLKIASYGDYANYLRNFANDMRTKGAPIYAISLQNEPSLKVSYDGMEWEPEEHRNFLRDRGNFTRSPTAVAGYGGGKVTPNVLVVSGEAHQVGAWYYSAMDLLLENPAALNNTDIVAYHIYGGLGDKNSVTRNGALTKETWMTEHNINSQNENLYRNDSTWNYVWSVADEIHHVIGNNNSSAFVWWYLKRFYGAVGDGSYGTANGAVMPRGHMMSHYALYATDTVRVNATTTHPGGDNIKLTAYQRKVNANKSTAVDNQVMANEDSYSIVIYDKRTSTGSATLRVNLPGGFIATKVTGIISDSSGNRRAPVNVVLNPDGDSADFTLPQNAIVSLKFVK